MRLKFINLLILIFISTPALADSEINKTIQKYLNALGYNVGPVDGILGKNSKKQLLVAISDHGYTYDGNPDKSEIEILKEIAKKRRVKLPSRMIGINRKNLEQIMDRKTASFFAPVARNIKRADSFEIVDFKGRRAARMSISMRDKGHPDDWRRFGKLGEAQRIQIQEKEKLYEMIDGKEYWYKFSIFIPKGTGSNFHTISPFDLKDRKNGSQRDPALAFTITNNQVTFQLKKDGEECRTVTNMQGKSSKFCERPGLIVNMHGNNQYKNKWLDFVFQIDLRKARQITRFWINGKIVGIIGGDLSPDGKYLGFKFGPYRNSIKKPPQDETIYYADIMRKNSCAELQLSTCEQFLNAQKVNGFYGARQILRCFKEPQEGKRCPIVCKGNACKSL